MHNVGHWIAQTRREHPGVAISPHQRQDGSIEFRALGHPDIAPFQLDRAPAMISHSAPTGSHPSHEGIETNTPADQVQEGLSNLSLESLTEDMAPVLIAGAIGALLFGGG